MYYRGVTKMELFVEEEFEILRAFLADQKTGEKITIADFREILLTILCSTI